VFERIETPEHAAALSEAIGSDVRPIIQAADLAVTMRRTRAGHLERLREHVDPSIPMLYVPYLFMRSHGMRTTRQIAEALSMELGH
jgi:hypothetical protein